MLLITSQHGKALLFPKVGIFGSFSFCPCVVDVRVFGPSIVEHWFQQPRADAADSNSELGHLFVFF